MIDLDLIGAPAYALDVIDDRFVYRGMNQRFERLTGFRGADLVGRQPRDCLPPRVVEVAMQGYRACVADRDIRSYEAQFEVPDGHRWLQVTLSPVLGGDGAGVACVLGMARDVTDRRTRRIGRREEDVRVALAMEVLEGGYWHYDVPSATFETSPPLTRFLAGEDREALDLDGFMRLVVPRDRPNADLSALIEGRAEASVTEYRVETTAGPVRWMRCRRQLLRDDGGRPSRIIGVAVDITEQKQVQARAERTAVTDPLTGLVNRRGFEERAEFLMRRARGSRVPYGFGVLMVDLDRFKPVNDRHGHLTGDGVLQVIAKRLLGLVRPVDTAARLGGDEFAVLVDDAAETDLSVLAERLVRAIAVPMTVNGLSIAVGASVGAARFRPRDEALRDVVARADASLYEAKNAGRGLWKLSA